MCRLHPDTPRTIGFCSNPNGRGATTLFEIEGVIADNYSRTLELKMHHASRKWSWCAIFIRNPENHPGGIRAITGQFLVIRYQKELIRSGVGTKGPSG